MRFWACAECAAALATVLWGTGVAAAEIKRFDGIHRIEKKAQITQAAVLELRDKEVCGTSMQLCPPSMSGGCCPDNYSCAEKSCYATTQGPSTCGGRVGWQACAAVYGGGCCPDGYMCQTAKLCVPPSGSPYTFGCPSNQFLCPSSLSYGCCPNGMGCAVNQCYSTEPTTQTTTMIITTTEDGSKHTITTTATTVRTPHMPTTIPTSTVADGDEQVLKFFPSAIAKVQPSSEPNNKDGGSGGGLSSGQLAGIVTGAVLFLIIVLIVAFVIIRHLNKVVAAVGTSKQSESSKTRPQMKEFKPTDSEIDCFSVDPLMMSSPQPSHARYDSGSEAPFGHASPDMSSANPTPSSFAGGYQPLDPNRNVNLEAGGNVVSYFDSAPGRPSRFSMQSSAVTPPTNRGSGQSYGTYSHVRNYSNASDPPSDNDASPGLAQTTALELEARPWVQELAGSPTTVGSPGNDRRRSSGSLGGVMSRPPLAHQRGSSEGRVGSLSGSSEQIPLSAVSEEAHGYQSIAGRMMEPGETASPGAEGTTDPAAEHHHTGDGDAGGQ